MKTLNRHRWTFVVTACAVVLCGTYWLGISTDTTAYANEEPDPLSQVDYDAVVNLMAEIDLDRDALVALNPTLVQCEAVLPAVLAWWATNSGTIATLQGTIDVKVQAVRNLEAAIATGPYDAEHAGALTQARDELATAVAARNSAIAPLRISMAASMSESQNTTWDAIADGFGNAMPLRMLDLSDAQRLSAGKALRTFRRNSAAAQNKETHDTAVAALNTAIEEILTEGQETIVGAYESNFATASDNVAGAMDSELILADG